MDADRRHELKDNDLAVALGQTRDFLDRHGKEIGIAALVILGIMAAVTFAMRSRAAAVEDVWRRRGELKFDDIDAGKKSLDSLESLAKEHSDPTFVMSAILDQGQKALRLAQMATVPPDKELNERARKSFTELKSRFGSNPVALGAALLGLATVAENDFVLDGDLKHKEEAKGLLDQVVKETKLNGMPYQGTALDRLKTLDQIFVKVVVAPAPPPPPAPATDPALQFPATP